jgi:glycerophosphoryl diester phosphodiesterase
VALISAHRGGWEGDPSLENSLVAMEHSIVNGAEYVEFDVQRCADGTFVVWHDDAVHVDGRAVLIASLTIDELVASHSEMLRYTKVLDTLGGREHPGGPAMVGVGGDRPAGGAVTRSRAQRRVLGRGHQGSLVGALPGSPDAGE